MSGSGTKSMAVQSHFDHTSLVAQQLAIMFEAAFPDKFEEYRKAFAAGVWVLADPGPWLGRVVVYKLQLHLHVDKNDDGPTACFPSGLFQGGALKVPQMGAKFTYVYYCFHKPIEATFSTKDTNPATSVFFMQGNYITRSRHGHQMWRRLAMM